MKTIKSINLNNNRTYILIHIVLALFIFLCFRAGLNNFVAGDDFDYILDALEAFHRPASLFHRQGHFIRPVQVLFFGFNTLIAKENAISYHLTLLLIHMLNVVLVSYFISHLCKNRLAGLLGSLFWGVNYKHVEVVFRPTTIADSLVLLFWLGAFFLFLANRRTLAAVFLILGIFSKEHAVILPLLVVLYIFFFIEGEKKIWLKRTIPLWIISFLYIGFRNYVTGGDTAYLSIDWYALPRFWEIMLSQIGPDIVYVKQVWLAGTAAYLLPGWIAAILFVVLGIAVWKLSRVYRFGLLWMSVTVFPTVFITHQSSRYRYVPLVGLGLIVGHGLNELLTYFRKKDFQKAIFGISTAFILVLGYYVIGLNLEEQDYAFYGEIHRQAAESFKQHILLTMSRDTDSMAVFFRPESGKWVGELFERNRLNPWYLPGTYKWVYVRPHAILGLTNTYSFVSYCTYNDVKDTLFVEVPYEEFRKKLLSGDFYIIIHNEGTNTFEFGSDTLKAQLVKHINDKNSYSFLQPGHFVPMNKRRI